MTGWTLSTVYNGLARLDWRPGGGPLPGLWTRTSWSNGGSAQGRVDVAAAADDLSQLDWRPVEQVAHDEDDEGQSVLLALANALKTYITATDQLSSLCLSLTPLHTYIHTYIHTYSLD